MIMRSCHVLGWRLELLTLIDHESQTSGWINGAALVVDRSTGGRSRGPVKSTSSVDRLGQSLCDETCGVAERHDCCERAVLGVVLGSWWHIHTHKLNGLGLTDNVLMTETTIDKQTSSRYNSHISNRSNQNKLDVVT
jgi:hypothetical protein